MVGCLILGIFSVLICVAFCVFRAKKANIYSLALKTLSSICFILCAICALHEVGASETGLLILAGLVMGLVGDIVLDLKIMHPEESDDYFVLGTSAFSIGHMFYFVAALFYNTQALPSHTLWNVLISCGVTAVLTIAIMFSSKKMGMDFGKMKYLVAFYSFILTFMVSMTTSIAIYVPIFWIVAGGMILFFISDLVLSMQYFGGKTQKVWIYVNHILYYLAQVALALSILWIA